MNMSTRNVAHESALCIAQMAKGREPGERRTVFAHTQNVTTHLRHGRGKLMPCGLGGAQPAGTKPHTERRNGCLGSSGAARAWSKEEWE